MAAIHYGAIDSTLHTCNVYCEPSTCIHASIILCEPHSTAEDVSAYCVSQGATVVSIREVSEIDIDQVREKVYVRSLSHTKPFLAIRYAKLYTPEEYHHADTE